MTAGNRCHPNYLVDLVATSVKLVVIYTVFVVKSGNASRKGSVWYGFWAGIVTGAYCIKNDVDQAITVNGEMPMITNSFWSELDDLHANDMRF